ncbi:MAG: phosphotransferase [Proteobacteria bacterium]|nr:phosphotransferase [Pseudomonadota bacterium]MDA1356766.1 phosphotransferase [Pseudomonadota bacterium]
MTDSDFYKISIDARAARMERLAVQALKAWDITDCRPQLVKIRENAVFRVTRADGFDAALRIHRFDYHSDAALQSELSWIRALQRDGIKVPAIIPASSGAAFVTTRVDGVPEPRQVDMVTWLDGEPLGSIEGGLSDSIGDITQAFTEVGRLVAQLHNHSTSWQRPDGFVRHAWDADGLTGEAPLWGRFWEFPGLENAQRQLMEQTRLVARRALMEIGEAEQTYGLIHADLNFDNILIRDGRVMAIDFDDCGAGWHLFDLATISILFLGTERYDMVQRAVIAGYRQERPLTDETLRLMPLFYLLRAFTYLGWIHTRNETRTAQEIAPSIVTMVCELAEQYLRADGALEGPA